LNQNLPTAEQCLTCTIVLVGKIVFKNDYFFCPSKLFKKSINGNLTLAIDSTDYMQSFYPDHNYDQQAKDILFKN